MCEESLPDTSHQSVTITQWGVVLHLAVLSNDGTPGDNPSRMFASLGRSEVLATHEAPPEAQQSELKGGWVENKAPSPFGSSDSKGWTVT